jgi:1-acyl-sn-glycerol-3-phosphate acyltransferase
MVMGETTIRPLGKEMGPLRRLRARFFALPFMFVNETTHWDFSGQDKLLACIEEHQRTGRGLITVSNHVSLFDDPLVLLALLGIRAPSEDTKVWYSTACADNFNPKGRSIGARITRYFSEVSNIVFLSRAYKRGDSDAEGEDPVQAVLDRCDERLEAMVERRAAERGLSREDYIQLFLTPWGKGLDPSRVRTFNQSGLLESCVRVDAGDWVHFFPEGGRSRDIHLRGARPGVGKVIYHAEDVRVLPMCFYGTQDIMPVGAKLPKPGKKVYVKVGDPIDASRLRRLRSLPESLETYQSLSGLAMEHIAELRTHVLKRYLGEGEAARLLLEETQMEHAMRAAEARPEPPERREMDAPLEGDRVRVASHGRRHG